MEPIALTTMEDFFKVVSQKHALFEHNKLERILYRGQSSNDPLLPSIARIYRPGENGKRVRVIGNTRKIEEKMLGYLKRAAWLKSDWETDLDLLIKAQHYGMKTRLLDWTTNPLVALYFAIENENKSMQDSYFYILEVKEKMIMEKSESIKPLDINETKVLRPSLSNDRVLAQSGWFTIHEANNGGFYPLEEIPSIRPLLSIYKIPSACKSSFMEQISNLGANARTVFPDFSGTCKQANFKFQKDLAFVDRHFRE